MAIRSVLHSPALKTWVLPILLVLLIVGSALAVVQQVFMYRQEFRDLQEVRKARENLDVEWSRLLIEQQTFGATAQIGSRAVMTLRMYSPPPSQTVVLTTPTL
ncbi:cell division protein FtsL [Alkanindiges hydrocarboniclasticus]|jgi:cell division protein FtsL|uniref:Cell division protein FtsL n=1 Tax=Alkanindiges hydrocarboniclasticus TaxID=1907941 RepID=A0A1S8CU41_9GAMM|nr:cell division protein FtsL [Alkanindiges hydrocarboniclasticus]ONG38748.1 cell division protein FtsL [Alkanindiges hydrocarboniclasticus]